MIRLSEGIALTEYDPRTAIDVWLCHRADPQVEAAMRLIVSGADAHLRGVIATVASERVVSWLDLGYDESRGQWWDGTRGRYLTDREAGLEEDA